MNHAWILCSALALVFASGCKSNPQKKKSLDELHAGLMSDDAETRADSAKELGRRGEPSAAAVPTLKRLSEADEDPKVRKAAAKAASKINDALARKAIDDLEKEMGGY